MGGSMQMPLPPQMLPVGALGPDNSFEQEVEPIQRALDNRFHPMEGVIPPEGMQGINGLGSEGI